MFILKIKLQPNSQYSSSYPKDMKYRYNFKFKIILDYNMN